MAFDAETYSSPTQELVFRSVMCSTIKRAVRARALDVGVIVLPHRRCSQKGVEGRYWHLAIRVIDRSQLYDHELLGLVIARSVDEAAPRDIGAGKGRKIQLAVIFHVDGLCRCPSGAGEGYGDEEDKSKHARCLLVPDPLGFGLRDVFRFSTPGLQRQLRLSRTCRRRASWSRSSSFQRSDRSSTVD